LEQILFSSVFSSCERLRAFLSFIVESALAGRSASLKAYTIAVDALERNTNFDPSRDAIVRVEATRLRAALARYYKREGSTNPVLITMPAGSYVPQFAWNRIDLQAHRKPTAFKPDILAECRHLRLLVREVTKTIDDISERMNAPQSGSTKRSERVVGQRWPALEYRRG
jgi:hypothetical protein